MLLSHTPCYPRHVGITHDTARAREEIGRLLVFEPMDFMQIDYSAGKPEAARRVPPVACRRWRLSAAWRYSRTGRSPAATC